MDVAGATAAAGGSSGFIHTVVGSAPSPLFFWLLTVALVAAIHIASVYISSSPPSRSGDEKPAKKGFAGEDGNDDRILELMRSFSFVHASEEDFVGGSMGTYDCDVAGGAPEPLAPAEPPPTSSSLSFKFQYQIPEIPLATPLVSREIPAEGNQDERPSISMLSASNHEHEAEETEVAAEEEQSAEVVEATPKIVSTTHNYRFLTERDFRGFVTEPEAMTVRVQESFMPPPPPARAEERRVVDAASRRGGGLVATNGLRRKNKPGARDAMAPAQPEVLAAPLRRGGLVTANDLRLANKPGARDAVESPRERTAPQRRNPASSPSGGRTSFASEFSGFGDSDSESSASDDGYSVRDLVVDSDSDWFLSEKDFPAAHDAASLRSYKAKVLKAMESLKEATKLELSFQDSATMVSPGSVTQASPDSIRDGSLNYPQDMWSRSPSPDAEYKQEKKQGSSLNTSDDEEDLSSGSKQMVLLPVYDADSAAQNSLEDSDKETITINDHSDQAVSSDVKTSPSAATGGELAVSSHQAAAVSHTKGSQEPSDREFASTNYHSFQLDSAGVLELATANDQPDASISDEKGSPEHSEKQIVVTDGQTHVLISDVWEELAGKNGEAGEVPYGDKRSPELSEKEFDGTKDHSYELTSGDRELTVHTYDQPCAEVSDESRIPEHLEQEFSVDDHQHGVAPDSKNIPEPTEDEHATENDHSGKAPRHVHFSVTEKAKALDEEGEDQEGKWKDLTEEEEDELESLWEHQDLIEQLKLELKKVRSAGLPTIMEESESPNTPVEDLKPFRIDAKFLREDPMDELNKFYKSYRERMRKFDMLCYQKMYAIDFLQLRGPQRPTNSLKALSPTVTSILSHNFRSSRRRTPEDPSERFLKELRYDLETVYVGQMCLAWEFLRWQYEQARDLPESDPYHSHQYNKVAGEFQQFHVVVQRFVEDECFKGPRLPNYINNRCVLRNLLQVPVIKEDSPKDRMEDQRKGNYVITSEEMEDIMEESMRILWEFIKADRAETTTSVLKGLSASHVELQDPLDHDLMMQIHATLQKKEKRLKDLLRTGNCLVKKFKKPKEDRSNQNLFFSQVDMRLVARVLRMPRITSDQLQWCKAKLDKIILVDHRKIHREASFLLFPC